MRSSLKVIILTALMLVLIGARCDEKEYRQQLTIVTWAGDGTQGDDGDGHHRLESWLNHPVEMIFGPDGMAYIMDWNNHRLRRVSSDGKLETLIGTILPGDWPCQNPAVPVECEVPLDGMISGHELSLNHPIDIAFSKEGVTYIAAWHNHKVYQYDPASGLVGILAGQQSPGFTGEDGAASSAKLNFPSSLVVDRIGNLLVSDERNNRVRRISKLADRVIKTVAGSSDPSDLSGYGGDGGPAIVAKLALTAYDRSGGSDNPPPGGGLAMDKAGSLYIADTFNHCIRKVVSGEDGVIGEGDPNKEIITTVAGVCGSGGFEGDGGPANKARLKRPHDLDFGPDGRLYVADTYNHVVRAIDLSTGIIQTVAGTGKAGFSGDGGPATSSRLRYPYGVAVDPKGRLYIIDTLNNRIRVVADPRRERHG